MVTKGHLSDEPPAPTSTPKNLGGRPPTFDRGLILEQICEQLEEGKPLSVICRMEGMPCRRLVAEWMKDYEEVAARVASARLLGEEWIMDEVITIADDLTDKADSRKVRCWARVEAMKRQNPKRWGDQAAGGTTVSVAVGLNIMTEERLADLQARKKASILRNAERAKGLSNVRLIEPPTVDIVP